MIAGCWRDGWRRVAAAPAIAAGAFALTYVLAVPLTIAMHDALQLHLGRSLAANEAADHVNYDWWQEFASQAPGVGATFSPAIIGFAATLDNISSVLDGEVQPPTILAALAFFVAGWAFLTGGTLDRYARQRRTHAHGFFAASGVYFLRFLRLAAIAGLFYWWMFGFVHHWLFAEWFETLVRGVAVEREAVALRAAMYLAFGAVLLFGNLVFDYAKIRAVVEDRRSMAGAVVAALRFVALHPRRTVGLYALNAAMFLALLAVWALAAPGAGGGGAWIWVTFAAGQVYLFARVLLKLHFLAAETAMFQGSLAHAVYTAAPRPVWPESPAAESIAAR